MRVLITGASGQLGSDVLRRLVGQYEVVPTARHSRPALFDVPILPVDLADLQATLDLVRTVRPQVIVHAAAYTSVDRAEREPETASIVNRSASAVLAEEAARSDAVMVYVSTDYVFDGSGETPWRETDPVGPLNVYGVSKLAGEDEVRRSGARHVILRTSWLYAPGGANFVTRLLPRFDQSQEIPIVTDQIGAPTPASLVGQAIKRIIDRGRDRGWSSSDDGVFHVSASGQTSWYGFAHAIRGLYERLTGRRVSSKIVPITSASLAGLALRPANCRLDCSKFAERFGMPLANWQEGLSLTFPRMLATPGSHERR